MDTTESNFKVILEQMDGTALILLLNCIKTALGQGKPLGSENKKTLAEQLGLDWEHIQESLEGG